MSITMEDGIRIMVFDLISTTAMAGLLLMLGYFIRKKVPVLEKFCIPAPVVGGLVFAITAWVLRSTGILYFRLDTALQTPFMIAFFATVGFGGSFALLKSGGKALIVFLSFCWIMAIAQNVIGTGLASLLGIEPILGVMAGAVSLTGGHGNAAAFGPEAEKLGVMGAEAVAIASATYGLIAGSLLGGPIGRFLIERNQVKIETEDIGVQAEDLKKSNEEASINVDKVLKHMTIIGVFMVLGGFVTLGVKELKIPNFALPSYVGAMFMAIIFRNINDKVKAIEIDMHTIEFIQSISLGFFLTMAIMGLKIWELADLALPLIIILLVQTLFVIIFIFLVVWPCMRKDYDAATMSAGFTGVGLGITATAIASMTAVNEKYKKVSVKAMLIVPLCCAVFIDIAAIPAILFFLKTFAPS